MKIATLLLAGMLICPVLNAGEIERIKELTREIQILNLLNGFELTEEQGSTLKKYIREAEKLEREFEDYLEENGSLFEAGLEKSIEILQKGKPLPPSLKKEISSRNHQVKLPHRELEEGMLSIAKKVELTLAPHQVQQLEDYIPCLIPPPGTMRIG
jgi:hypothetical protein